MKPEGKLIGYYNYTVVLTYMGMLTGFYGIICCFQGRPFAAIMCLIIAGLCDIFDGTIAATMERNVYQKNFGIQIDSLSDLICFCALPAMITYVNCHQTRIDVAICGLFVLCGLIRLAYFNVDEAERQRNSSESRVIYYGLPVTLSAVFIPIVYGLCTTLDGNLGVSLVVSLIVMGMWFILPVPLKKPGLVGKLIILAVGIIVIAIMVASKFM